MGQALHLAVLICVWQCSYMNSGCRVLFPLPYLVVYFGITDFFLRKTLVFSNNGEQTAKGEKPKHSSVCQS